MLMSLSVLHVHCRMHSPEHTHSLNNMKLQANCDIFKGDIKMVSGVGSVVQWLRVHDSHARGPGFTNTVLPQSPISVQIGICIFLYV